MKVIAVAVEGVLARASVSGEHFAASSVIEDGMWLYQVLSAGASTALVSGSADHEGVEHWLRQHGISGAVQYSAQQHGWPTWRHRLLAFVEVSRQQRADLLVVDAHEAVCKEMWRVGASAMHVDWQRRRVELGEDEHVPLRPVLKFWDN